MVTRGVVTFSLVASLFAIGLVACENDRPPVEDMGVPDLSIFIGCNPDLGTQTNPACPKTLPQCHPAAQICVGCIPSSQTCLPGFTCSQDNYVCIPLDPTKPCTRNVDCPQRIDGADPLAIVCNTDNGTCVECVLDTDCVDPVSGGPGFCQLSTHRCNPPDAGN